MSISVRLIPFIWVVWKLCMCIILLIFGSTEWSGGFQLNVHNKSLKLLLLATKWKKKKPNRNKVNLPRGQFLEAHGLRKPQSICNKVPNKRRPHDIWIFIKVVDLLIDYEMLNWKILFFKQIFSIWKCLYYNTIKLFLTS